MDVLHEEDQKFFLELSYKGCIDLIYPIPGIHERQNNTALWYFVRTKKKRLRKNLSLSSYMFRLIT